MHINSEQKQYSILYIISVLFLDWAATAARRTNFMLSIKKLTLRWNGLWLFEDSKEKLPRKLRNWEVEANGYDRVRISNKSCKIFQKKLGWSPICRKDWHVEKI